ncbi:MAG: ABC transporter ATP-binding protein, partial [Deltaproteobacteria bacterium]
VLDEFHPRAREILKQVHLEGKEQVRAADLSHGQKRNLEIGISLTQDPKVLLLDEPTSGMGREDVDRTVQLGREVAKGRTVVLVEHNMGVVAQLAHRITVLARGQVLARGTYDEVRSDPRVVEAYLGEAQ